MLCSESGLAHVRWREKQMNILVCDDNENAVNTITTMLQTRCQEKCISAKLYSYTQPECVNVLEIIDIAFLDIDMPGMNGITLAKNLRLVQPRAVIIFVTNFIQYAPEGYEVKAFRYLLKSDISIRLVEFFDLAVSCRQLKFFEGFERVLLHRQRAANLVVQQFFWVLDLLLSHDVLLTG